MPAMVTAGITIRAARRLALARAGLLPGALSGLPDAAPADEAGARAAAHAVIRRFGYLQLDTLSVAGARSHALVLLARLDGFPAALAEALLRPGEPLFEYWGHEASWIPLEDYPLFEFRRRAFRRHPWWGDVLGAHRALARRLLRRIEVEGPLRSSQMGGGPNGKAMWDVRPEKRVASALWSRGDLAVRERRDFLRTYDLAERVVPETLRTRGTEPGAAARQLLLRALDGHGWAERGTLLATFRFRGAMRTRADAALRALARAKEIVPCRLLGPGGSEREGWIRPAHLEDAAHLEARALPPRAPVLLSPFDPLLWDRERARLLFGFDQVLEIYVPPARRRFGYFVLPVLAGERIPARVDVKADREAGRLRALAVHLEDGRRGAGGAAAVGAALARLATSLGLEPA
jgi:uncharacterized protein YcaQ